MFTLCATESADNYNHLILLWRLISCNIEVNDFHDRIAKSFKFVSIQKIYMKILVLGCKFAYYSGSTVRSFTFSIGNVLLSVRLKGFSSIEFIFGLFGDNALVMKVAHLMIYFRQAKYQSDYCKVKINT